MKKTNQPSPPDPKCVALRQSSTLHPHPDRVTDPLFLQHDFFDARDSLQVKYEMLRRVQLEGKSISGTAPMFGCSRPAFYQAQAAFQAQGLPGLLPHKRGPHQAHKLNAAVLDFVQQQRASPTPPSTPQLLRQIRQRFNLAVHRRSLERAWARRKKKLRRSPRSAPTSSRTGRRPGRRL